MKTISPEQLVPEKLPLERDSFLRSLIGHLAETLQDVVGLEEASGFISVVGREMGLEIAEMYRSALQVENLSSAQVAQVLVDLKQRIKGDFWVISEDKEKIVLGNRSCPFGDKVLGRPALCMMTSNVFGSISADELGYARVELQETIATGSSGCKVVIYLNPENSSKEPTGREYFKGAG